MEDQNPNQPDFQPKKVDQPIFNSEIRQKLSSQYQPSAYGQEAGGLKAFYRQNRIYFWAIGLGVVVISVLAYFAFRKVPAPILEEANVQIRIDVPETAAAGSEVIYKINVENQDARKLVDLELELNYPEGVSFLSSSPKPVNLSGSLFSVPDLASKQNAAIFVKTRASGNINDVKKLNVKLRYKYDNFNSEFVKEQESSVRLVASDVLFELSGPATANNAQLIVYNVKYRNDSDKDIENARVTLQYPQGFEFAAATPSPSLSNNTWNVELLPQNQEEEIQIQGSFKSVAPGESKTAQAEFLIFGNDGKFFIQAASEFSTQIGNLPLLVSQELEGYNVDLVVDPGEVLSFRVKYQNNASVGASSVNIAVTLDSSTVDLGSLRAEGGQISGNTILWNASTVSRLSSLNPNESGELSFSVKVKDPATRDSSKDLSVVSNIKIKSDEHESFFPGNELALKISSPSEVKSTLQFVSGQLPPQVGRSTTYRVKFSLFNSSNDFSDAVVTAYLPLSGGGFKEGSVTPSEKSKVEFDSSTGKLTWRVGSLPAHTGKFSQAKSLEFELTLSPSEAQIYSSPTLVKDIQLSAKDTFTGQSVSEATAGITTNSLSGQDSYGKGTVQP